MKIMTKKIMGILMTMMMACSMIMPVMADESTDSMKGSAETEISAITIRNETDQNLECLMSSDEDEDEDVDYEGGKCGDNLIWKCSDGTLTISGSGRMYDYDKDDDGSGAPWESCWIEEIIINNGVTHIGNAAFYDCDSVKKISLPSSLTSIGDKAFWGCGFYSGDFTSITIPDNVISIGKDAFALCTSLSSVTLSSHLTTIGNGAFADDPITEIVIPKSVTSIGIYAFGCDYYYPSALKTVTILSDSISGLNSSGIGVQGYYYFEDEGDDGIYRNSTHFIKDLAFKGNASVCKAYINYVKGQYNGADAENWTYADLSHTSHTVQTFITKATISKSGSIVYKCSECGAVTDTTVIAHPKQYKLSASSYTYDGKAKKPSLKIYGSDGSLISSSNYTITYPSGCKNVGTYSYKISFKGNYYSGTKTVSFTILPKKAILKGISTGSKYIIIKASAAAASLGASGYQAAYRMTGTSKWTYITSTAISKKISKLNKGKRYQVKIRAYKKSGSKIYYGSWSNVKTSAAVK